MSNSSSEGKHRDNTWYFYMAVQIRNEGNFLFTVNAESNQSIFFLRCGSHQNTEFLVDRVSTYDILY